MVFWSPQKCIHECPRAWTKLHYDIISLTLGCWIAWMIHLINFNAALLFALDVIVLLKAYLLFSRWPMLIDTSGQASTFLRYRDTNYICTLRPKDMENNNVRRCLLGALR